jgi:hypothetical protein
MVGSSFLDISFPIASNDDGLDVDGGGRAFQLAPHVGSVSWTGKFARTHIGVAAANKRDGVARLHHADAAPR